MDKPGPNLSSVTGFPWGSPEGNHLFFLLQHICIKCWYKPIFKHVVTKRVSEVAKDIRPCMEGFAVSGHCDPAWRCCASAPCRDLPHPSCSVRDFHQVNLHKAHLSLPWDQSLEGGTSLGGPSSMSWQTPCEKGCEVFVIFGKLVLPFCPVFQIVKTACPVRTTNYN